MLIGGNIPFLQESVYSNVGKNSIAVFEIGVTKFKLLCKNNNFCSGKLDTED